MQKRCLIALAHLACAQEKRKTLTILNMPVVRTVLAGKDKSLNVDKIIDEHGADFAAVTGPMTYLMKGFLKNSLGFQWASDDKAWKKAVPMDADYELVKADLKELTDEWGLDLFADAN